MSAHLRRLAIGILVVGTLALVGWIAKRQLSPGADAPDDAVRAELALAGPDQTALAFLDVAMLARLLSESGTGVADRDFDALLLEPLGLRGVSLARDVSRAVVAVSAEREIALVLFGSFDADAIEAAVRAQSGASVREVPHANERVLHLARLDPETCAERPLGIALRGDRVVVTGESSLEPLLARLAALAPSESGGRWLRALPAFEGDPLFRLTLTQPARLAQASDAPAARALLGALARLLDGASSARVEVRTRALGDGLAVAIEVAGGDPSDAAARWDAFRAAARAEWTQVVPALAAWQDALAIEPAGSELRASGKRGAESIRELAALPDALLVLASRDFRGPAEAADADAGPIETDPEPLRVAAEQPLTQIRSYSPDVPLAGAADVIAGPFGIRIERASRANERDAPLELAIRCVGPALANLPEPDASPRLVVDAVQSEAGESLLRDERCGPDRNGAPARLVSALLAGLLEGTKTVRLVPGATLDSVVRIAGRVEVDLPTRVEKLRAPAAVGAALESEGVAIELTGAAPDHFSYRVTGDPARLIEVRGLDADLRPLAAREAFELERLTGGGRIGARHYSGGLATVEAVFALETETLVYPFGLTSARPGSDGEEQHVESSSFIRYTPEQYEAEFGRLEASWPAERRAVASASAGPFSVGLDGLDPGAEAAARLTVIAPNVPNLSYHATALELALTRVGLADGRVLTPAEVGETRAARALLNGRRQFGRTDVEAKARVATGVADAASALAQLDGQLVLRLPREVDTLEIASVEPGVAVTSGDVRVTLQELGRDRLTLRMTGPLERFFSVRAFAADGHELAVEETDVPAPGSSGPHEIRFDVHGRPARLGVQLVRSHTERRYTFRIQLPGALPAAPER